MDLIERRALRSASESPFETRWRAIDLFVSDAPGESEILVRTKLVRDAASAAVCLSEAICHRILGLVGLSVAEACAVQVDREFAADLSTQHDFEPQVRAGRHWGTVVIAEADPALVVGFHHEMLLRPSDVFLIYVVDVLTAYADRQTQGNVLLVPAGRGKLGIIPIDQSDCFGGPACICDPAELAAKKDKSCAKKFIEMEALIIKYGRDLVDDAFNRVRAASTDILAAVHVPPDEWYEVARSNPDEISRFLEHRIENLDELARKVFWGDMADIVNGGGGYVLPFRI